MKSQPFVPKEGEEAAFSFELTPTYLFRLHAPRSAGKSSTKRVSPPAYPCHLESPGQNECFSCKDVLQLEPKEAASRLGSHLLWSCDSTCNLMSWSSSLLFVLQYGLYRHEDDFGEPPLAEVFLIMLDTRKLPKQTFLRDLDAIKHYVGYDDDLDKVNGWRTPGAEKYFGEYLTQGHLDIEGICCQVSMQQLIDAGLFKLCTSMTREWRWIKWPRTVCDVRNSSFHTLETNHEQVQLAISMGLDNMEARFAFPFAAMLLSLHARDTKDQFTWDTFHAKFTDEELNDVNIIYDADIYDPKGCRMKEVDQFRKLVEAIRDKRPTDSVEQISEALKSMSVANTAGRSVRTRRRIAYPHH